MCLNLDENKNTVVKYFSLYICTNIHPKYLYRQCLNTLHQNLEEINSITNLAWETNYWSRKKMELKFSITIKPSAQRCLRTLSHYKKLHPGKLFTWKLITTPLVIAITELFNWLNSIRLLLVQICDVLNRLLFCPNNKQVQVVSISYHIVLILIMTRSYKLFFVLKYLCWQNY